ncbi:Histone deacetylase 9 [Acipenser ruthenus]|uniref:histone deacetylase n=1 Tax=Acipenser ruthenus TaxID=7906 RepID=A0A444TVX6_ACIRT|nr:Histone deacetylase 9 [Acipenser ruthenus]
MTLLSFDGTTSWEVFHAQLVVLGRLCSWSEEDKAQQLTTALREDAQMVLLNLAEEEMGSYRTSVAALQRWFGSTGEPELVRARFWRQERAAGESLARQAMDLEREACELMLILQPENRRSKHGSSLLKHHGTSQHRSEGKGAEHTYQSWTTQICALNDTDSNPSTVPCSLRADEHRNAKVSPICKEGQRNLYNNQFQAVLALRPAVAFRDGLFLGIDLQQSVLLHTGARRISTNRWHASHVYAPASSFRAKTMQLHSFLIVEIKQEIPSGLESVTPLDLRTDFRMMMPVVDTTLQEKQLQQELLLIQKQQQIQKQLLITEFQKQHENLMRQHQAQLQEHIKLQQELLAMKQQQELLEKERKLEQQRHEQEMELQRREQQFLTLQGRGRESAVASTEVKQKLQEFLLSKSKDPAANGNNQSLGRHPKLWYISFVFTRAAHHTSLDQSSPPLGVTSPSYKYTLPGTHASKDDFPLRKTASEPNLKVRSRLKQKVAERRSSPLLRRKDGNVINPYRKRTYDVTDTSVSSSAPGSGPSSPNNGSPGIGPDNATSVLPTMAHTEAATTLKEQRGDAAMQAMRQALPGQYLGAGPLSSGLSPVALEAKVNNSHQALLQHLLLKEQMRQQKSLTNGDTTVTQTGDSTVTQTGDSAVTQTGDSAVTQTGDSTVTQTGDSTVTQTGDSTVTQTGDSAVTQTGDSTVTQTGDSAVTQTGDSAVTQAGDSTVTQTGDSTVTQAGGSAVQTGDSTVTQAGDSTVTQTGDSTVTQTGDSTVTQTYKKN